MIQDDGTGSSAALGGPDDPVNFPPEDEEWASQHIEHGEVRVIPSIYGHFAGLGNNPADNAFIDAALTEFLARPV